MVPLVLSFGLGYKANEARKGSREEEEEIGEIGVSAKKKNTKIKKRLFFYALLCIQTLKKLGNSFKKSIEK